VVLQSLIDILCYYSHPQTIPVVLQSLKDSSCGTTVTHRHFLWYYSHWQVLLVALQSIMDTTNSLQVEPDDKRLVVWSTVSEQSLGLRQITLIGKSDPPVCITEFISPLFQYKQPYDLKWLTPSNSTKTLLEHSLLPKCHRISWYMNKCNFTDIEKKSTAFPCQSAFPCQFPENSLFLHSVMCKSLIPIFAQIRQ
jgi:hypothetical protein